MIGTLNRRSMMAIAPALLIGLKSFLDDVRPEVATASGRLAGVLSQAGGYVFKGIPYASPIGGRGRFMPPRPPRSWTGVRPAVDFAPRAPQSPGRGSILGPPDTSPVGEDCLTLNVWTPAPDAKARPVMVWLHGGGFSSGSANSVLTDGARLSRRGDVVVVTVNHRLNGFGFLYLDEIGGPAFAGSGNAGMLDIVAALRWVRDNIAAFGGNPDSVTIFGESGGGAKVSVLMGMPSAAGLFHRAVVQSGSHLTGLTRDEATENASALIAALGLKANDIDGLVATPMQRLIAAIDRVTDRTVRPKRRSFSPVVDGSALPRDPWLPDATPYARGVPIMIGSTRTETTLLIAASDPAAFTIAAADLRTRLLPYFSASSVDRVLQAIRTTHPDANASELFFLATSNRRVRQQGWVQAEAKLKQGGTAFVYELVWDTPVEGGKWMSPHGLDIGLVFDNVAISARTNGGGRDAQAIADAMADAWIAFARHGNPSVPSLPWPRYDLARRPVMLFSPNPRVVADWRGDERRAVEHLAPLRVDR